MKHLKSICKRTAILSVSAVCGFTLLSTPQAASSAISGRYLPAPADDPDVQSYPIEEGLMLYEREYEQAASAAALPDGEELPARFDLRDVGAVTAVGYQYGGTCGVFSAIGAIESNMIMQGMVDNTIDLSEEHFSYFAQVKGTPDDPDDPLRGDRPNQEMTAISNACSYLDAIGIMGSWMGVVPASMTPRYRDKEPLDESLRYESVAHLQNVTVYAKKDAALIKKLLMEKGAMQVTYFNVHEPELYSEYGGYYQTHWSISGNLEGQNSVKGARHAVCLIGWDDNFPKEHFVETPPGDGAWIIKNSWGVDDPQTDNGFIYISYYDPSLYDFVQFEVEPTDNYDHLYQNCCELNTCIVLRNKGINYANVFTAEKDENITAAGMYTSTANVPFRFSIYALKEDFADPCDGELLLQTEMPGLSKGYHTFPLDKVCQVSAGQKFSAVVEVGVQSSYVFSHDEGRIGERNTFVAIYEEGTEPKWVDGYRSTIFHMGNTCLKLYTKDGIVINEENFPELADLKAAEALDKNGDGVLTEKEQAAAGQYIRGDVNRDGKVNAIDLSLLKQILLGSDRTGLDRKAADWDTDGTISTADAQGLLDFLLQIPDNE